MGNYVCTCCRKRPRKQEGWGGGGSTRASVGRSGGGGPAGLYVPRVCVCVCSVCDCHWKSVLWISASTHSKQSSAGRRQRDAMSRINKQNYENIVALTDEMRPELTASTSLIRPLLLLDCTVCPVHTKSIHFWPIINNVSHMDNSNSLCQQHETDCSVSNVKFM